MLKRLFESKKIKQISEFLDILIKALALFIIIYHWVFQISVVKGESMMPLFLSGDRLIVEKVSYAFNEIKAGDLVVFQYPRDISKEYLKRVIGCPYDTVKVIGGKVFVNGKEFQVPNIMEDFHSLKDKETVLLSAEYFVMGDNRPISSDSRDFGTVPQGYIKGRVLMRFWPLNRFKLF